MKIQEYKQIRNAGKDLSSKIFRLNNREELLYGGKFLGFWNGKSMVFETDLDSDVLTDFLIYERYNQNTRLVDRYFESNPEIPDLEKEFLEGMLNYHASLFEIKSINKNNNTLILKDLIKTDHEDLILMDIGLSETSRVGIVFYARLLPIRDINMTSGVSFGFDKSDKNKLMGDISFARFKHRGKMKPIDLYLFFYKKSKSYGLNIIKL